MNEETSGQMLERLGDNAQAWAQEVEKAIRKFYDAQAIEQSGGKGKSSSMQL
jgi:hypothetical protein